MLASSGNNHLFSLSRLSLWDPFHLSFRSIYLDRLKIQEFLDSFRQFCKLFVLPEIFSYKYSSLITHLARQNRSMLINFIFYPFIQQSKLLDRPLLPIQNVVDKPLLIFRRLPMTLQIVKVTQVDALLCFPKYSNICSTLFLLHPLTHTPFQDFEFSNVQHIYRKF